MLSRRNVRIKIMQLLYARSIDREIKNKDVIVNYRKRLDDSFDLYAFTLYLLTKVASYAQIDADKRKIKHRPTDEDKIFQPRLYHNEIIQAFEKNDDLQDLFNRLKFNSTTDTDVISQVYRKHAKDADYKEFSSKEQTTAAEDKEAILSLFREIKKDELFIEAIEDKFYSWNDDKSLVIGAMKKTIKGQPKDTKFLDALNHDPDTTENYGMGLLTKVLDTETDLMAHIEPMLKNWDAERVAKLDMIIIKMALAEMIAFKSIPTKATINEYVEIAKNYSTDKSKEFVNGILDNLMKTLTESGVIVKEGRGLL